MNATALEKQGHVESVLEAEDLVRQLADRVGLLIFELLQVLLHGVDHRWRAWKGGKKGRWAKRKKQLGMRAAAPALALTAQQDLDVVGRVGELFLDGLLRHKAAAALPTLWRLVEEVVDTEALRVILGDAVKLLAQQNVVLLDIGVDEIDARLVLLVLDHGANDLEHGGDARAAGNHANMPAQVGAVAHLALGALDLHAVADLELADVLGDVPLRVCLAGAGEKNTAS